MKKFMCIGASVLLALSLAAADAHEEDPDAEFTKEVEEIYHAKIDLVTEALANDPIIIKAVRESNEQNKNISLKEIKRLDEKWQATKGIDEFVRGFISNECALRLIEFEEVHDGYPEIFISDKIGLIVGETNKTSDYYQADEDWWIKAYNEGKGNPYHSHEIEYDESAMAESVAAYIPIMDPDTNKAIGVMKVIVDIIAIKMAL